MITSDEKPRNDRIVRIALIGSIFVHLLLALFVLSTFGLLEKLHIVFPHPKPKVDETVAVSSSLTLDKRTRPKPAPPPTHSVVKPVQPKAPAPQSVPVPQQVVQQPPAAVPVPAKQRHELAKSLPKAPPEPPKTVKAEQQSETPTAPPTKETPSPVKAPRHVAIADPQQRRQPQKSTNSAHLSEEQLAQIQSDLSQTISHARSNENPLTVTHPQPPSAPKHYNFSMTGVPGDMRSAQGLCSPISNWTQGPWDYYYMSCNVAISDGTTKVEAVPWPVRWPSNRDPYNGTLHMHGQIMPLAGPLPGWQLPPGTPISQELLQYARSLGAQI